jgi:hypothetical protein
VYAAANAGPSHEDAAPAPEAEARAG